MKTKLKSFMIHLLFCALGVCCAIVIWVSVCPKSNYSDHVDDMIPPYVYYHDVGIHCSFSEEYCNYLTESKRTPYFGSIPSDQNSIEITVFQVVQMHIYPNDDSSVILVYDPSSSLKIQRKYLLTGCFEDHLNYLYRITNDEVFLTSIDYPNGK